MEMSPSLEGYPESVEHYDSMSQVAAHFLAHGKELDDLFDELRTVAEPLTAPKLRTITALHGRLVNLLTPITRGQSPRSFASKYMHFHNPAVPIYDRVAASALPGVIPLYQLIDSANLPLSVKYLDNYLLWIAGSSEPS